MLFVLVSGGHISACSYAYQYSLFLLGSSSGELVWLEVELERYVSGGAGSLPNLQGMGRTKNLGQTRWKGQLKLKKGRDIEKLQQQKHIAWVDLADEDYQEALAPHFAKAQRLAEELPFFEAAELLEEAICDYDRSCGQMKLEADSLALWASLPSQKGVKAHFPRPVLSKFENLTRLNYKEMGTLEVEDRLNFYQAWKPFSVRHYRLQGQEIYVYSLGWGLAKGYRPQPLGDWQPWGRPLKDYIRGNKVMMHGQRFDFFQIL
ncbi:hypothetical protein PPO43_10430 [Saprospira sp. CCB-QB6]|uniref:hypothetical protein n=1 Tax=Saprospira sp. CCB-QB6 TaxID=3023936 RepID=UPI00234B807D|nr:hypothetical protein [Saprospira sp. CCB-QB6]WCL80388.1 hypothetical protein PPO43_10430 [Saprospira sp. CCB-QB6]